MGSRRAAKYVPVMLAVLALGALLPLRCASPVRSNVSSGAPTIRVRLLQGIEQLTLTCAEAPTYRVGQLPVAQLNSPNNAVFTLSLNGKGWQAGNANLGGGLGQTLHLDPRRDGSVSVNGTGYRGRFRFIPAGGTKFDVINEVDIDGYLMSVVSREMLSGWHEEAYKAQAIVARTYALYEKQSAGLERHWDVYPDTRSQVYGGIPSETGVSRMAVSETAGIVVAHANPEGQVKIFKAYFSSCCGGVTQSAADAFNEPYIPPLSDQNVHAACRGSPRFNWGPVEITKNELTRRFKLYGDRRSRPEKDMGTIAKIEIQQSSRWGRPVRFLVTDIRQNRFSLTGEEFRWAVNSGASDGTVLYSSFVKIINDSECIRFVEGHGWGHGVGMCQWCAQSRAESGWRHEDIVLSAFPTAVLVRAY